MSSPTIAILYILIGLGLIALRVHIGVAIGVVSFFGIATISNFRAAMGMLTATPFNFAADWTLSAIPMFLLMGYVASYAGLASNLFETMRVLLARVPGGLAVATVGASALMSATSGSSVATSASMTRIAIPEMLRFNYDKGLSAGVVASGGTLGALIPPSILLLLYGYYAEVSVAKLFIAGVIPGILSAIMFALMIIVRVKLKPSLAPSYKNEHGDSINIWKLIGGTWPLPVLIVGVLFGIFLGFFSPTEAGAVGALLAMLIALSKGKLSAAVIKSSVVYTITGTASIFLIIISTILLARFLAMSGLPHMAGELLASMGGEQTLFLVAVIVLILILGMFIDTIGVLLLTLPIILPIANDLHVDLIWFGIILVKVLEMSMVTPPVGLNVYVIKGALGKLIPLNVIFKGVLWFLLADAITLFLIVMVPSLSTWLPTYIK